MIVSNAKNKRHDSGTRVLMTETIREKFIGNAKQRGPHWTDWLKDAAGDFCRRRIFLFLHVDFFET